MIKLQEQGRVHTMANYTVLTLLKANDIIVTCTHAYILELNMQIFLVLSPPNQRESISLIYQ